MVSLRRIYANLERIDRQIEIHQQKIEDAIGTWKEIYIPKWRKEIQIHEIEKSRLLQKLGKHKERFDEKKERKETYGSSPNLRRIYKRYKTGKKGGQRYWVNISSQS